MKPWLILGILLPLTAQSEVIQVPEDCLKLNLVPCLVRSSASESLQTSKKDFNYQISADSILKFKQFSPTVDVDLLHGDMAVQHQQSSFKLNSVVVPAPTVFASRDEQKLKILDGQKFLLSEYKLATNADVQSVLVKVDFMDKKDLIAYLAPFFNSKQSLVDYLKKNAVAWAREFKALNEVQTKVLQRSIASVEEDAELERKRKEHSEKELQKVRETFFYRTFYR